MTDPNSEFEGLDEAVKAAVLEVVALAVADPGRHAKLMNNQNEVYAYRNAERGKINWGHNSDEQGCVSRGIMTVEDVK